MKTLRYIISVILFIFISCGDEQGVNAPASQSSIPSTGGVTLSKIMFCANDHFPSNTVNPATPMTLKDASSSEYPNERDVSALEAAFWWSMYATTAQTGGIADNVFYTQSPIYKVPYATKIANGNRPKIQWGFVFSHYYQVVREIGSTQVVFPNIANKLSDTDPDDLNTKRTFIDTSVDLNTITSRVTYKIYYKNFTTRSDEYALEYAELPEEYAQLYYDPIPYNASIDGATTIYVPAKYQAPIASDWSANVSGGVSPYSYSWYYNGSLVGTLPSYSRSYSFHGINADGYNTLTLIVTDQRGVQLTRSVQIFEDSYPYNNE